MRIASRSWVQWSTMQKYKKRQEQSVTHNPYSPPTADVADPIIEGRGEKPKQVVWAVRCLWASVLSGLVAGTLLLTVGWNTGLVPSADLMLPLVIGAIIGLSVAYWIIGSISAGRNWARILMLILVSFRFVRVGLTYAVYTALPLPQILFSAANLLLVAVAVGLMFIGPGKYWFRRAA